jgi:large subunit ribosomal protein L6
MKNETKKFYIKIPSDTTIIYSKKKSFLVIKGPINQKSISLKLVVYINKDTNLIKISSISNYPISNKEKKKLKSLRGTTVSLIKHKLVETSIVLQKKLKIHGVGYRVTPYENIKDNKLLTFKLGYSHLIYFQIPAKLKIFCFNKTKLCIFGTHFQLICQISAKIRSYKKPEPYKGKGILYENEKIILKEGKKV